VGGFLGKKMSVAYVDTSLIGPLTIRITLASPEVLTIVQQGITFPNALTDQSACNSDVLVQQHTRHRGCGANDA